MFEVSKNASFQNESFCIKHFFDWRSISGLKRRPLIFRHSCISKKDDTSKMARLNFLHPRGPARSFVYPSQSDILDVPYTAVLCEAEIRTVTGRTYTMTKSCQDKASNILKSRIQHTSSYSTCDLFQMYMSYNDTMQLL